MVGGRGVRRVGGRSVGVRVVVVLASCVAVWHVFASFLWIAPVTALREVVPGGQAALSSYMLPFFGQSWSVFAPEPINGNYDFRVRALMEDGRETEWVSAVGAEQRLLVNNVFPPRASQLSSNLASNFKGEWDKLSEEQRERVGLNFFEPDEQGRLWLYRLDADLRVFGDGENVNGYIAQERRGTAYATQVAYAVFGSGVVRVQFEVSRQNVIPFAQRNNPDAQLPPQQVVSTGWRGPIVLEGQDQEAFSSTFSSLVPGE